MQLTNDNQFLVMFLIIILTISLREGFDKDQPGCSAEKFWDHNFFDQAESTTYGDQLGGGLWVGGSPGPPGQGGKVSGGHKGPFVANLQIASSRPIFIQMSSY